MDLLSLRDPGRPNHGHPNKTGNRVKAGALCYGDSCFFTPRIVLFAVIGNGRSDYVGEMWGRGPRLTPKSLDPPLDGFSFEVGAPICAGGLIDLKDMEAIENERQGC